MPSFVLLIWPLVSLGLFAAVGPKRGFVLTVVVGYLFLPPTFFIDLPVLPPYGKGSAIAIGALLGYVLFAERRREEVAEQTNANPMFGRILIALVVINLATPFMTILTNRETLVFGTWVQPGLGPWEAISLVWSAGVLFIPFFLARRLLATPEDQRMALRVMVGAGVVYALLVLFEIRMSPQLNNWVYGYFPHSWIQHIRDGGWRPIVFLSHGLVVGLYLFTAIIAALALSRGARANRRVKFLVAGAFIFGVLMISRNLGASMIAILLVPVIMFTGRATQIRLAMVVSILFLFYPVVRQSEVLPLDRFTTFVQSISADRAHSFMQRLHNEQILLERALEKPMFGWGRYGRNRVFDEFGRDTSTPDGLWVIVIGQQGWVGYLTLFGLVVLPVIWLRRVSGRKEIPHVASGIAVMMAGNFIDLVPNSTISPVAFMMVGALAGFIQFDTPSPAATTSPAPPKGAGRALKFSRFGQGAKGADRND